MDDVRLVPGAADAIRRIRSLDYRTVVVSNQPGVAKGKASHEDLRAAHAARRSTARGTRGRDRRLPLLPAPPGSRRPLPRRCVRVPEAQAGNAARGRRRPRHRSRQELDDRGLRHRRRRPDASPGAERSSSRTRGQRIAGATAAASTTGCRTSRRRPTSSRGRRAEHARFDLDEDLRRRRRPRPDPAARGRRADRGLHDESRRLMWKAGLTDYAEFAQEPPRAHHRQADLVRGRSPTTRTTSAGRRA